MQNHVACVETDCLRAAIYREPRAKTKIIKVITLLTKVTVDVGGSTEGFYKVSTSDGVQGYCMKKFIAVRR